MPKKIINNMVSTALAEDVNGFDTSPSYGSEEILGKALQNTGINRKKVFIGTMVVGILGCGACAKKVDLLEQALRLAGDNRPELERVLAHYSQRPEDSLKLRAARFLIKWKT